MSGLDADDRVRAEALVEVFRRAEGRMAGLPLLNPALVVEGRGFRPVGDVLLGVIVTPWCMILILLPRFGTMWLSRPQGSEVEHVLPCGTVRFVTAFDGLCGDYRSCSLFSPVTEFADQEAARATADAALAAVLAVGMEAPDAPLRPEVSRRALFRGLGA